MKFPLSDVVLWGPKRILCDWKGHVLLLYDVNFLWYWRPKCGRIIIKDALILIYADITENGCGFVYLAKSGYVSIVNAYKNIDTSLKGMSFLVLYELGLSQWKCIEIYVKCWLHFFLSVMKSFVFICGKWTLNKFYSEFQAHAVLYGIKGAATVYTNTRSCPPGFCTKSYKSSISFQNAVKSCIHVYTVALTIQ